MFCLCMSRLDVKKITKPLFFICPSSMLLKNSSIMFCCELRRQEERSERFILKLPTPVKIKFILTFSASFVAEHENDLNLCESLSILFAIYKLCSVWQRACLLITMAAFAQNNRPIIKFSSSQKDFSWNSTEHL